jgi:Raf kinase inhibitor-like YbhB/YbcL family protein
MRTAAVGLMLVIGGCASSPIASPPRETAMRLTSAAFEDGGIIPAEHTCDGEDLSPPLAWTAPPDGTEAFALVVEDPDAGGFVHWVLTNIPGETTELPAAQGDRIGRPGPNGFGAPGWGGPCPPSGEHEYVFTLYALSDALTDGDQASASDVRAAMEGNVLAEARLTGRYQRGG